MVHDQGAWTVKGSKMFDAFCASKTADMMERTGNMNAKYKPDLKRIDRPTFNAAAVQADKVGSSYLTWVNAQRLRTNSPVFREFMLVGRNATVRYVLYLNRNPDDFQIDDNGNIPAGQVALLSQTDLSNESLRLLTADTSKLDVEVAAQLKSDLQTVYNMMMRNSGNTEPAQNMKVLATPFVAAANSLICVVIGHEFDQVWKIHGAQARHDLITTPGVEAALIAYGIPQTLIKKIYNYVA